MGLAFDSFKFVCSSIPKYSFFLLLSDKRQGTPSFVFLRNTIILEVGRIVAADFDAYVTGSSSVNHRGLSLAAFVRHFLVISCLFRLLGCGFIRLTFFHHRKELVCVHGLTLHVCFLVVNLDLSVLDLLLESGFPLLQDCIYLTLSAHNFIQTLLGGTFWDSGLTCR